LRITDADVKKKLEEIILKIGGHPVLWFSVKRAVKHLKATILWIHDEEDKITPLADALKVKEENHPNIQFVITNGLGHSKIYRDAGTVKTIIDFL
jgi:pimeloyl-ACP methyl ester carboxylesterase